MERPRSYVASSSPASAGVFFCSKKAQAVMCLRPLSFSPARYAAFRENTLILSRLEPINITHTQFIGIATSYLSFNSLIYRLLKVNRKCTYFQQINRKSVFNCVFRIPAVSGVCHFYLPYLPVLNIIYLHY